jgi:hypothetical protein
MLAPSFDSAVYQTMAPSVERAVCTSEIAPATLCKTKVLADGLSPIQDQTTANQERELREVATRMGYEIVHVYRDHGVSGAKGRDKRPQFDKLCRDATKRQFDVVMAWSVDRLGRSLLGFVEFLTEIHALKVDLYLHQQGIDTTTPAGKATFQMMACSPNSSGPEGSIACRSLVHFGS